MDNWRIHIEYRPSDMRTYVYVMRKTHNSNQEFLTKGGAEAVVIAEGSLKTEDIHFMAVADDHILSLLIEAFDKRGIKAPAQSYIEGKLEAKTEHLEDLRKLIPKLATPPIKGKDRED